MNLCVAAVDTVAELERPKTLDLADLQAAS
jgi:hypothetical protein